LDRRRGAEEVGVSLHLIKLCVGCDSIEDLASWQAERLKQMRKAGQKKPRLFHRTFQMPKRREELLDGGSLYWVIKGIVQVRQPLLDITEGTKDDGTPCCLLIFKNELVPVRPVPRRAFQGWRYLDPDEAPEDLKRGSSDIVAMPPKLRKQLAELGLL
jgi:hypothetical protein